jgi:selenide,water dikinase
LLQIPDFSDPNLLVGNTTSDDASVYKISDHISIVNTVDFFPPIVDDPFTFGEIAAANSLSDIYAMGAKPITALNIVGFPQDLNLDILIQILKGGASKAKEANIAIAGGHTVVDKEPKYGLSVTGIISTGSQITNSNSQIGDVLILTKPIGTGIITTAGKQGLVNDSIINPAIEVMKTLNRHAAESMVSIGVNSCTDITGFGLLGHLKEMMDSSNKTALVNFNKIPVLSGVFPLINDGIVPGGTFNNLNAISESVEYDTTINESKKILMADAQTSGGLLISVNSSKVSKLLEMIEKDSSYKGVVIGNVESRENPSVSVKVYL